MVFWIAHNQTRMWAVAECQPCTTTSNPFTTVFKPKGVKVSNKSSLVGKLSMKRLGYGNLLDSRDPSTYYLCGKDIFAKEETRYGTIVVKNQGMKL